MLDAQLVVDEFGEARAKVSYKALALSAELDGSEEKGTSIRAAVVSQEAHVFLAAPPGGSGKDRGLQVHHLPRGMGDRELDLLLLQPQSIVSAHHEHTYSGTQNGVAACNDMAEFHRDERNGIAAKVLLVPH